MEVTGQPHTLATFPPVPTELEVGWTTDPSLSILEKRQISFPCQESNHDSPVVQPVDWAIQESAIGAVNWVFPRLLNNNVLAPVVIYLALDEEERWP